MKQEIIKSLIIGISIIIGFSIFGTVKPKIDIDPSIIVNAERNTDHKIFNNSFPKITFSMNGKKVTAIAGEGDYSEYKGFHVTATEMGYKVHMFKPGEVRNGDTDMLFIKGTIKLER